MSAYLMVDPEDYSDIVYKWKFETTTVDVYRKNQSQDRVTGHLIEELVRVDIWSVMEPFSSHEEATERILDWHANSDLAFPSGVF